MITPQTKPKRKALEQDESIADVRIRCQLLARQFGLRLNQSIARPRCQAFLRSLGIKPIGDTVPGSALTPDDWAELEIWMHQQITEAGKQRGL